VPSKVLLPVMMLTGLIPGMDAILPWLVDLFGGRQSAQKIRFIVASVMCCLSGETDICRCSSSARTQISFRRSFSKPL